MKIAVDEQNATAKGNLSRAAARQNLGHFSAYFGHIQKTAVFFGFFRLFVVFFRCVLL
jgi:hypothetical protein